MTPGFVKYPRSLHRELMELPHDVHAAFLDLLCSANYERSETSRGECIERGQVLTSYAALSERWNVSIKRVRTILKTLQGMGLVTFRGTGRGKGMGTLISVENYAFTQDVGHSYGHNSGQESGHDLGQSLKKSKKMEEEKKSFIPFEHPTLEKIQAFDRTNELHRDPISFFYHHDPNWADGNGKAIYDWRSYYQNWTNPNSNKNDLSAQILRVFGE